MEIVNYGLLLILSILAGSDGKSEAIIQKKLDNLRLNSSEIVGMY